MLYLAYMGGRPGAQGQRSVEQQVLEDKGCMLTSCSYTVKRTYVINPFYCYIPVGIEMKYGRNLRGIVVPNVGTTVPVSDQPPFFKPYFRFLILGQHGRASIRHEHAFGLRRALGHTGRAYEVGDVDLRVLSWHMHA
ncbi:hypothetical protein L1987_64334 [Smallanthus sonchifolius]|uniref:Uncharacterized protein n=1 Tax=Smallanthus sonchifolius TaxID=185202 RepID=A0ACB9CFR9_9ASTR|nr:hypothetical protein L1987_64334 [Smallanthus sonchifolius]